MDKSLLLNRGTLPIFEHPQAEAIQILERVGIIEIHTAQLGRLATHLELTRIKHQQIAKDLVATSSPEERIKDIINQLFRKGNGGG